MLTDGERDTQKRVTCCWLLLFVTISDSFIEHQFMRIDNRFNIRFPFLGDFFYEIRIERNFLFFFFFFFIQLEQRSR